MAAEYFKYDTTYGNTLVARSDTSFAPSPPFGEIYIDYFIPEIQPLYLYRESGGTIILNIQEIVEEYLEATAPPPSPTDYLFVRDFTEYTNVTAPATYVNVTGDSMTGTLRITGALSATQRISGLTAYGSSCIYSPIICGTSCTISPITIGSTCVCSPVVLGSVSVCSPTVCSSTCLCSTGTARFTGAVTAASTLNVSGNTTLGSQLYLNSMSTGGTLADYTVVWNPTTKQLRSISPQGSSCVYCYTQNTTPASTTSTVNQTYLTATWTLPVGTYSMEFNVLYGNRTSNRCAITCFLLDGAIVGYCNLMKTNDTNVVTTAYVTQDTTFATCTSHTFSIVYRQCGGGSVLANYGAIRVQKIGV